MKVREVLEILEREGWVIVRQRGSHRQLQHPSGRGTVTVAGALGDDIPRGTLASFWRQAHMRGKTMKGYAVVIEHEGEAWGAYVPDLGQPRPPDETR